MLLLLFGLLAWSALPITAFVPHPTQGPYGSISQRVSSCVLSAGKSNDRQEKEVSVQQLFHESDDRMTRRQSFQVSGTLALASMLLESKPAWSVRGDSLRESTTTTTTTSSSDMIDSCWDALTDLPPLPTDYCRIFLCRHGQTENNRLRLVQGARVDIPINDLGRRQGQRAGRALARAHPSPSILYHSPLIRARQTAQEAVRAGNLLSPSQSQTSFRELQSIMEVDFGDIAEGKLVEEAKPGMAATYARWAIGNVDYRPDGGGDSGRDVISRAVEAVNTLTEAAASKDCPNRCVAAFTHSTYLRILLGVFLGDSLARVANMRTDNGGINVIDVNLLGKTKTIGPKSKLVGGLFSQAPRDFEFEVPVANVVRVNEIRHLKDLV